MLLRNDDPMITFPENDLASANKHNANNAKFEKRVSGSSANIHKTISSRVPAEIFKPTVFPNPL